MEPVLSVHDIVAGYGDVAIVHEVSLHVHERETIAVVGPNGSGKSTLIKSLLGFARLFSGQVRYQGQDITGITSDRAVKLGVGYVPQTNNVFPNLSVHENLEMGAYIRDDRSSIKNDIAGVYGIFPELAARRKAWAGTLSGGERQMLAIARALMASPKVLLLDEPLASVSPKGVNAILSRIDMVRELGTAIILIEQNVKKALDTAQRSYILVQGVCVMEGDSAYILSDEDARRRYLGISS